MTAGADLVAILNAGLTLGVAYAAAVLVQRVRQLEKALDEVRQDVSAIHKHFNLAPRSG